MYISNILKFVFKMSSVCSNASSKTWTPLPDRYIDEYLLETFPLFDQARLQLIDVTNPAAVHTLLYLPPNLVVFRVEVRTVGRPQSWSDVVNLVVLSQRLFRIRCMKFCYNMRSDLAFLSYSLWVYFFRTQYRLLYKV